VSRVAWLLLLAACSRPEPTTADEVRLARGRYLAEHVTNCFFCHSPIDWSKPETPIVEGMKGSGVVFPDQNVPGRVVAPNITPDVETGIGGWTDDELRRALRRGISRDGRVLFPLMPYYAYAGMSDDDMDALIAYLRSIPPVKNRLPKTDLGSLAALLKPGPDPGRVPQPASKGAYLTRLADCLSCHTPQTPIGPNHAMAYAGGVVLDGPWGRVASVNITPHPSGIPHYTEEMFLRMMKTGSTGGRQVNPIMPWSTYRGMTDDDLKAMFDHVRKLKPISHRVDNVEEPSPCRKCGSSHGLGKRNE
jgi:cytochrome c553